ncbi:MAG: putative toxin-antitoxin system toxin component, PIN family [Candidatus Andersenbacteria bacterium]
MKYVLDTNVLIDGFQDDFNAQARLVEAVRDGELIALVTSDILREYRNILRRLINDEGYKDRIEDFLFMARACEPVRVDETIDDPDDYKFLQAAVGGDADAIVTNDRHLLDVGKLEGIDVITPQEAWSRFEDETGGSSEWMDFVKGIGIG